MNDSLYMAYAFTGLFLVLNASVPILTVFGFFEDRTNGFYRFRTSRFLAAALGVFILNICFYVPLYSCVANLIEGAEPVAEQGVLGSRATAEYTMNNLNVMFPGIMDDRSQKCYRAALSNYVEDQWDKYLHDESCNGQFHVCATTESDYYEALLNKALPTQNLTVDMSAMNVVLGSVWLTASNMYKLAHRMLHIPDKEGHFPDPPDVQMIAEQQKYLTNCSTLKPLSWVNRDDELMVERPHLCIGKCP